MIRLHYVKPQDCRVEVLTESAGPGNVVWVDIESENLTEIFTAFGRKGVRAEEVAAQAANEAAEYLEAGVPVGRHLADQLLLPMALAGGGAMRILAPSQHTTTQIDVIRQFLGIQVRLEPYSAKVWHLELTAS